MAHQEAGGLSSPPVRGTKRAPAPDSAHLPDRCPLRRRRENADAREAPASRKSKHKLLAWIRQTLDLRSAGSPSAATGVCWSFHRTPPDIQHEEVSAPTPAPRAHTNPLTFQSANAAPEALHLSSLTEHALFPEARRPVQGLMPWLQSAY